MASKSIDFDADKQILYQELGIEMANLLVDKMLASGLNFELHESVTQ